MTRRTVGRIIPVTSQHITARPTLSQVVEEFLNYKKARNLSSRTNSSYEYRIRLFLTTFETVTGKTYLDEVLPEDMVPVLTAIQYKNKHNTGAELGPRTMNAIIDTIKDFFYWRLKAHYEWECHIDSRLIRRQKEPTELPRALHTSEVKQFLDSWDKTTFTGFRGFVISCLMLDTGIRRHEVCNLKISHIKDDMVHIIHGKGNKDRVVPLSVKMIKLLDSWLQTQKLMFAQINITPEYVFCSQWGRKLKPDTVSVSFRRQQDTLKRDEPITCHVLRHTYAYNFILTYGTEWEVLRRRLGHSSIVETQRYAMLFSEDTVNTARQTLMDTML